MFGIRFFKAQPGVYFLQYSGGRVVREGTGISFFYYAPASSLVAIPLASIDVPFIFGETTEDFQEVSIQGQVTYRVRDPKKLSELLNFTLAADNRSYLSEDPEKLPQRVINQVQVRMRDAIQKRSLQEALRDVGGLVSGVKEALGDSDTMSQLGIEVLALSVLALKPSPETSRALEADVREQLLLKADEAIYLRRNAAVEHERSIRENELKTEIAVENKKREIREAKVDADRAIQEKRQVMSQERMKGNIVLEEKRRDLVSLSVKNSKEEADARGYGINAAMEAFRNVDPRVMQALAGIGMNPAQLIAGAFQNLADNADRIGNLNIAPELLQELMRTAPAARES